MRTSAKGIAIAFAVGACLAPFGVQAVFDSGSTGADGPFNPPVSATIDVPPNGIFNYTTVSIPAGVTITYRRNTTNTPVVILASGNVTIGGTINVSGANAADAGVAGSGAQGDDAVPGKGGPGGFDGGRGGTALAGLAQGPTSNPTKYFAGAGMGPGGGGQGYGFGMVGGPCACIVCTTGFGAQSGAGGGFSTAAGVAGHGACSAGSFTNVQTPGGASYGSRFLLPLIGGSGGGGGGGGEAFEGSGGGGGGGAILIASSGTVSITGSVLANGGASGASSGSGCGATGGGGSGGAIRIVATAISGAGTLSAAGGAAGSTSGCSATVVATGSAGSPGFIRLEAETITRPGTAPTSPVASTDLPGNVFVAGLPALRIASVAGFSAPATPTGTADITLPSSTPNPVTVVFETTGVPVGNTILLTVTPAFGNRVTAITPALTGSTASATASTSVSLPGGPSVLSAQTTYTVVAAIGDLLKNFAGNERVERVTLMATLGGPSRVKLITVSGKEYEAPAEVLRIAALGG